MSAAAEFGGGILLILGLFTRPVAFIMAFNMFVAAMSHFARLDPWPNISAALSMFTVFFALIFTGAGKFSLDNLIFRKKHVVVKEVEEPVLRRAV
jgi:putative oxidoreductase